MSRRFQDVPAPRVAAIYCRVSSKQQNTEDKVSLETQEAEARKWCAAHGWAVDDKHVYREIHTGEDLWERRVLQQLLADAKVRPFGLMLSHSVDRLSRDKTAVHLGIITDQLERAGVAFDFVTEAFESTPLGFLTMQIRGFAAGMENERRKERTMRANQAKALGGKLIPGPRPLYGYQWGPERSRLGKLLKIRLVIDPVTSRVVIRIYVDALAGKTIRGIAAALTADGIPTPTGRSREWDAITVRNILKHPAYWGAGAALRNLYVPVDKHLRAHYVKKHRRTNRPLDAQIPLSADVIPPIVPAEWGRIVAERLAFNQRTAVRNARHPELTLLRAGFAVCGYCEKRLAAVTFDDDGKLASRYYCQGRKCEHKTQAIEAHRLDGATWEFMVRLLKNPEMIRREYEQMLETETPGSDQLALIDERIAKLTQRITNKRKYAELVDDDREREALAEETRTLIAERSSYEAERVAATAHFADWQNRQAALEQILDISEQVGQDLAEATYERKRTILAAYRVRVKLYRAGHCPRAELSIDLPLSGVLTFNLDNLDCDEIPSRILPLSE
jgi:site-specific DNA recombinase